ncbi:MAG: adenylate/guanylate cyclase domain-containing protein [Proteobacteria bacterium]|nr:MAG: adenylate/guanylate cyclase domain-containing protein [Pseudomonadota bacterium]
MKPTDRSSPGIDAYVADVFDRRIQDTMLRQILGVFPEAERSILADQVGMLAKRLDSLVEATNKVREPLTLEVMLTRLVALITEAFDADRSSLFLYDADSDELFSRIAQGDLIDEIRFNASDGVAGAVFRSGDTLVIDDAYSDLRFNPHIDQQTGYKTRTILCVPVTTRSGDVLGVAEVLNKRVDVFTDTDSALLKAFTTHVASALENMQLVERAQVSMREESRIREVTQAISSELDTDRLLRKIMSLSTELLDAERSTLFLHDPIKNELWSRVAEGINQKEIRIPFGVGIAGEVFTTRTPINIADAYADPRFNKHVDQETGFNTRSILCVPVVGKHGIPIGVVQVLNHKGGPFTARDQLRLEMVAAQSAIALDNARLFREVLEERNYSDNVLRSLTNGVLTFDTRQNVVKINDAAARILKCDAERILGATASNIFRGKNRWIVESLKNVALTKLAEISMDAEILNVTGETLSVNLNLSPLIDSVGDLLGSTMVIEDITNEKRVRSTMARYMTREIADQVLEQGALVLGGRSQLATIVFTDIIDFTTLSEHIGPQGTVTLLNEYFTEMVEVVFAYHGILDKYIGDAIMAVFGAPFPSPKDADNALCMAIEMQRVLKQFNHKRHAANQPPVKIRIGINSDQIVAGNIGSERRMDYTVIGDGVNLAARLESANKQLGTNFLISGMTENLLQDSYHMRELDFLRVKGKTNPVPIFEVLGYGNDPLSAQKSRLLASFAKGLQTYRKRDWLSAARHFKAAVEIDAHDEPSRIFLKRCENYSAKPPGDDWDGVWTLYEK